MPSIGQIIPEFLHPHVASYINDNTLITESPAPVVDPLRTLMVFTSGKGRDNVLIDKESQVDYLEEFGNPNYALYGQPGYMPFAFLGQPNTRVSCMRVMPDDATYANVLLVVKVKVDDTDPLNKKLLVKHLAQFFPSVSSPSDFIAAAQAVEDTDPDVDGYQTYPLMLFRSLGRGLYGNNMRVRVSSLSDADKDNDYKNYRVEVFTTENGLQRVEMFASALFEDATQGLSKNAYFIEDVVNENSNKLGCYVVKSTLEKIFNIYKADVNTATTYTVKDFDFITGINKYTFDFEPTIDIDRISSDVVNFDRIEGLVMSGGDDGAFSTTNDPADRANAINDMYLAAFRGEIDKKIKSKRRVPCEFIFDANYADDVKKALINLMLQRYDAFGYVDAGILATAEDALTWADFYEDYGDRIFSKECQHFQMRDPFSGKRIPMTTTYFIASKIAAHFRAYDNVKPFVGESFASLTGHIKNTLLPVIDADDMEVKEALYLKRVNYFQAIGENLYVRSTQTTSQFSNDATKWSDLSEENNMHVLLEMKRIAESYVAKQLYNFASAEERAIFTQDLQRAYSPFIGIKVTYANVKFAMNEYETERSILHCYIDTQFRTMGKRGLIEIDINKRV
jgi:hypothetical protein